MDIILEKYKQYTHLVRESVKGRPHRVPAAKTGRLESADDVL